MVKFLTIMFFCFCIACNAQMDNFWWNQTSTNQKFEEIYKYVLCDVKDGVLKKEVKEFIRTYLAKNEEEIAIDISYISEGKYRITYRSNYYSNFINNIPSIQQIAELDGRIIFIRNQDKKDSFFNLKKEILFGLLRDRFKLETKIRNINYKQTGNESVVFVSDHEVPSWLILIKDDKLISKNVIID